MTTFTRYCAWLPWLALLAALAGSVPACSDCNLSVSTTEPADATVGVSYSFWLTSSCGGDSWFIQTGNLPPGIGLQDNGKLKGVPTIIGLYAFTVGVVDFDSGETAYKGLSIQVNPAS